MRHGFGAHPVVLVGLMGSGKSTVGRIVAERLGRPFVDLDERVAARAGRSIAEIFADDGEGAFRVLELAALAEVLDESAPAVVAAGGGIVTTAPGRRALCSGAVWVVWLDVAPAVAAVRVGHDAARPLLGDDPAASLGRLAGEREAWYREVANFTVDAGAEPEIVADRVLALRPAGGALHRLRSRLRGDRDLAPPRRIAGLGAEGRR